VKIVDAGRPILINANRVESIEFVPECVLDAEVWEDGRNPTVPAVEIVFSSKRRLYLADTPFEKVERALGLLVDEPVE